jgi:hypothetical protein
MVTIAHARQFVRHVLPAVLQPLRVLWNQVIGFFFVVLAVIAAWRMVPIIRDFKGEVGDVFRLLLSAVFVCMMAGFGLYSFWRAHRVPKS